MKKLLLSLLFIVFVNSFGFAQYNYEIGARFGNKFSFDAIIPIKEIPRVHGSFEFNNDGVMVATYLNWLFPLKGAKGIKVYPGIGPEVYLYDSVDIGIAGDFGIEYKIEDLPLTVGFDYRPGFIITEGLDFHSDNWGFIVRYNF